jgi:AraC-like DNA-binding protein
MSTIVCSRLVVVSDIQSSMSLPHDSPALGKSGADFAANAVHKIGVAFGKGRRVSDPDLKCVLSGEEMTKKTHQYSSNGSNGAEPVRIWKARNFIHAHSNEELSLGKVARAANTSPNYFSEKFKEATGTTFVSYVARTRFEKAAALLREGDLRVSEIAFATGFQSLSQFNRVFKKSSGKSPTAYRAAARVNQKRRR